MFHANFYKLKKEHFSPQDSFRVCQKKRWYILDIKYTVNRHCKLFVTLHSSLFYDMILNFIKNQSPSWRFYLPLLRHLVVAMKSTDYVTKWCVQLLHGHPKGNCFPATHRHSFTLAGLWQRQSSHWTPKQKSHTREDGNSANKCQEAHLRFETWVK